MRNSHDFDKEELDFIAEHITTAELKELVKQKQDVLKQINKAQKESSSALANPDLTQDDKFFNVSLKWFLSWKLIVSFFVLMMIIGILFWSFSINGSSKSNGSITEQIRELATLTTAEAHVKTVMEQEDYKLFGKELSYKLPGTQRKVLMIVPATVIAGVDLSEVSSHDVKVDKESNVLKITVPHASIVQEPIIDMEKVQTFSNEGIFRSEVKWDEGFDFAAEAKELIKDEAIASGIIVSAEENAKKVLTEFFSHLGYQVEIMFQ